MKYKRLALLLAILVLLGTAGGALAMSSPNYSIDWQARKMLEDGCSGFIQKPFKMSQLAFQIRDILSP